MRGRRSDVRLAPQDLAPPAPAWSRAATITGSPSNSCAAPVVAKDRDRRSRVHMTDVT